MYVSSRRPLFILALFCLCYAVSATVIGIDLGTTYSCVAVMKNGRVEIITNDMGNRITPSYVAFTEEGRLIGDAAKNQATLNPTNTVFDAKRLVGRNFDDVEVQRDIKMFPFEVTKKNDKPYITVDVDGSPKTFSPEEISAMVLTKMKTIAEDYLGEKVTQAVITVPAYFNDAQRKATSDAGAIAGLEVLRILNEPTAAAIAYGLDKTDGEKNVLIFDLGGGTFDVSILNIDSNFFEVLATAGDTHLGGEDFDQRVMQHFFKIFQKKTGLDATVDNRATQRLRKAVETAKRTLSSAKTAKIEIDSFFGGEDLSETLTRATFERLNNDLFRKTLIPVKTVLEDAGLSKNEIDEIVLVGGSTRIPKIHEMITKYFGREPQRGINPDEAVAHGAAVQAGVLSTDEDQGGSRIVLVDVTPLSLGIETVGGIMTNIIPRGTRLPAERNKVFSTAQDNQESVFIQVFEGERAQTSDNHQLGTFKLDGIPHARRGVPQIDVTFSVDVNGILHVTASEESGGQTAEITISNDDNRLSEEEIERMQAEAEQFADQDQLVRETIEARNQLENMVYTARSQVEDDDSQLAAALDPSEIDELVTTCTEIEDWMAENPSATKEDYQERIESLQSILSAIQGQFEGAPGGDDDWSAHDL